MGTTLTGTTPQDTYDSLIKVTDNGPLSGTAKYLSDGLGNDSVLALSTSAVGVSETSPLGKLHVKTADTGVSSVSAQGNLLVLEDTENGLSILSSTAGAGYILFGDSADNDVAGIIYDHSANAMIFNTNAAERLRITSAGNVGIGTSAPTRPLTIQGPDNGEGQLRLQGTGSTTSYSEIGRESLSTGQFRIKLSRNGTVITPLVIDDTTGNVGIGTSSPNFILETGGATGIGIRSTGVDGVYSDILSSVYSNNANEQNAIQATISSAAEQSGFRFQISDGGGLSTQTLAYQMNRDRHIFYSNGSERVRIDSDGLKFNGDTAAANALDDYEEGTFTLTFAGNSTAGTYTPTAVNATYTKIGRLVTLQYKATFAAGASGGSGYMQISGLPFAYASDSGGLTSTIVLSDASWGGSYLSLLPTTSGSGSSLIIVETAPSTGLVNFVQADDFNTSTDIRFTLTYQV